MNKLPALYVVRALLLLSLIAMTAGSKEVRVSSAAQITSALAGIGPGDTLTMTAGVWTNQAVVFKATGTEALPILLRAESNQAVTMNGTSTLRIAGNYLIVDGLKFENGHSPSGGVIEFQGPDGAASNYCRLTRTTIKSYNPASIATDYKWVSLFGRYNRVDHCAFENKTHMGTLLVVWLSAVPNYHRIDQNYFGPRPLLVDTGGASVNGGETIRVGTSDWSMYDSYTIVENNLFDRCDGEIEVISSKSCENTYRYNTFVSCQGMLTLRHGNRCSVYGNYFFANQATNSGGIRIIGEDHKVYNNYIERTAGSSMKTGITLVNGVPSSPLNRYFQVKRALIVHNTLVGNRYSIHVGAGMSTEQSLPPLDCVIGNNLIWSSQAPLVTYTDTPVNMTYSGNQFYGAMLGIPLPAGNTIADPGLVYGTDSLWRIGGSSSVVNAGVGSYSFVTEDMDGQQRTGVSDIGADEQSNAPILHRPLRKSDVGPGAVMTSVGGSPTSGRSPALFSVIDNFPNPFNPATTIRFSVSRRSFVRVLIYNGIGEVVARLFEGIGEAQRTYEFRFNGNDLSSGLYLAELQSDGPTAVRKMLLLK